LHIKVLTDEVAAPGNWNALINTAMFTVCTVSVQMIVGFLLAMLFARKIMGGLTLIGLQILGRPLDEARVLRAAYAYEKATAWRTRQPELV